MSSDQVTKGYFSYRSSTQTCVPHTRKFHLHEYHFFISWIWTPSSFHSHSNCSLHQFPLETKLDISKSEKELSIGSSTAPDINGRGRQAWGPEGWIYINGKISLNFWLPSTLPLVFFFFFLSLRCLLFPTQTFFQTITQWTEKPFQRPSPFPDSSQFGLPFRLSAEPLCSLFQSVLHMANASAWNSTLVQVI